MISPGSASRMGILVSGGLDSCILLAHLLDTGHAVQPFYVQSGLFWEATELQHLRQFLRAVAQPRLGPLAVLRLPVDDVYQGHWSVTGRNVPDECSPDEAVYLPGRNALLVIKAALWCALHDIEQLALAPLASNPFADSTDEFFAEFESALTRAVASRVRIVRPFAGLSKREVMRLGRGYPLEATFSCLAPQRGLQCGRCNKCAERRAAFLATGLTDPTEYANVRVPVNTPVA